MMRTTILNPFASKYSHGDEQEVRIWLPPGRGLIRPIKYAIESVILDDDLDFESFAGTASPSQKAAIDFIRRKTRRFYTGRLDYK